MRHLVVALTFLALGSGPVAAQQSGADGTSIRVTLPSPPATAFGRVVAAFGAEGLTIGESSTAAGRVVSRPLAVGGTGELIVFHAIISREGDGSAVTLSAQVGRGNALQPASATGRGSAVDAWRQLQRVARALTAPR